MLVEGVFSLLKRCCCTLTAYLEITEANILWVTITACVLHNIHEAWRELFLKVWVEEAQKGRELLAVGVPAGAAMTATGPCQ